MKRSLIILLLMIVSKIILAQDDKLSDMKLLTGNNQFDDLISKYADKKGKYSSEEIYFIGFAYFMKGDDENCLKYLDKALKKDKKNVEAHYIKGVALNYQNKYNEAIVCFKSAIAINPNRSAFYCDLGLSYYKLGNKESAIESFEKSCWFSDSEIKPFLMLVELYGELNKKNEALKYLYIVKKKFNPEIEGYSTSIFNIGLLEISLGNYEKAETIFLEVIKNWPTEYNAYSKLIQIYYHNKEYDKAISYKKILYDAHDKKLLKANLKDMFCYDQFEWNDKKIQAFERFQNEETTSIYAKHIFYILDNRGNIENKIQTEYSPNAKELGGTKYILCMQKGQEHSTFNIGFNDDFNYEILKKSVFDILEGKLKPGASFVPTK